MIGASRSRDFVRKLRETTGRGSGAMDRSGQDGGASRRELMGAAAAAVGVGALPVLARAAASGRQVAGFEPELVPQPETLGRWLRMLHRMGPIRFTGTPQARRFEEFLARQFTGLQFEVQIDTYKLMAWECDLARDCAISVTEDGKAAR